MSSNVLGSVLGLLFLALLIVILIRVLIKKNNSCEEYDERQMLERGKAYQCGFFTFIFELGIAVLHDAVGITVPVFMDPLCWYCIGLFLPLAVFSFIAVSRDAFFAENRSRKSSYILYTIICLCNLIPALICIFTGRMLNDGVLRASGGFMNLLLSLLFAVLLVAGIVREHRSAAEEED